MLSAKKTILALMALLIIAHQGEAWRRRRRRRCPLRDCQVSSWSYWSSCSASQCVEHGSHSRSRTVETSPSCGGAPCPDLYETQQCYGTTPVDCQLSSWSKWSACTTPCGVSGTQSSSRHRITAEQCGGRCTSTFLQTRACPDLSCFNGGSLKDGTCFCKEGYAGDCCEAGGDIEGAQKSPLSAWTIFGWSCLGCLLLIGFLRAVYVKFKFPERKWVEIICKCMCNINNGVRDNTNINNGVVVNANINNGKGVSNDELPRRKLAWQA